MLKKLLALLLAVLMVVSMAACANDPAVGTKPNTNNPSNNNDDDGPKDPVTITFHYTNGVGEQQYTGAVEDKLNEIMQAIPGYEHISIDLVPHSSNYATEITLAQSNGEKLDIVNTFWLDFPSMVADGDFIQLDDLLEKYPGVASDVPEWLIDYGRIDGDLYYIPTFQQAQSPSFFYAPIEYYEYYYAETGKDDAYIRSQLNSGDVNKILDFCESFYKAVVKGTGKTTKKMFGGWVPWHFYNKDDIALDGTSVGVIMKEGADCPEYWPLTDEFHDLYKRLNEWYKKGWTNDPTMANSYNFMTDDNSVVFGIGTNAQSEEAYGKAMSSKDRGTCKAIRVTDHCYIEGQWAAGGNAIYADCEHPEEAMMILELLMSEKCVEFYNTLIWGLEGIHYKWVDKEVGRIETLEFSGTQGGAETTYCAWNWNTGNIFNGWLNQSSPDDNHYKFIEEEIHNAESTVISPYLGFTWHFEDLETERSQCTAVNTEYFKTLYAAADYEARYAEYVQKLKTAGVDKIVAAVKEQNEEARK